MRTVADTQMGTVATSRITSRTASASTCHAPDPTAAMDASAPTASAASQRAQNPRYSAGPSRAARWLRPVPTTM